MNTKRSNFPIDGFYDHAAAEFKGGLVSNRKDAQRWRLTIGEPGADEKEWLRNATPEEKAEHNRDKRQKIHKRKEKVVKEIEAEKGIKVKPKSITLIINPDTKIADIYEFDGWHDRIGWRSEEAKAAYKGSVRYG